jgi:hypothetical protein
MTDVGSVRVWGHAVVERRGLFVRGLKDMEGTVRFMSADSDGNNPANMWRLKQHDYDETGQVPIGLSRDESEEA